jgi:hypothetical protein
MTRLKTFLIFNLALLILFPLLFVLQSISSGSVTPVIKTPTDDRPAIKQPPRPQIVVESPPKEEHKNKDDVVLDPNENKKLKMVIGIPTTLRAQKGTSILRDTLRKMIDNLSEDERHYHVFALLNAERDAFRARIVDKELHDAFGPEIESGLIKLIPIDVKYYPENLVFTPCKMAKEFEDKLMRVIWRSKQVIDSVYLMNVAKDLGDWYLELEDDNPPNVADWSPQIRNLEWEQFGQHGKSDDWFMLRFYQDGKKFPKDKLEQFEINNRMPYSFGLVYKTKDMGAMVDYLYKNYDMMPLDWLIGEYISNVIKKHTYQGPLLFKHTSQSHTTKQGVDAPQSYDPQDKYSIKDWAQCEELKKAGLIDKRRRVA